MIQANMLEAKTRLSPLVEAAEPGEQVILQRNGVPVAQPVPVVKGKLPFGFLKGHTGNIQDSLLFAIPQEEVEELTRL